jgi:DNA-binding beta-propeller fold protein YncE
MKGFTGGRVRTAAICVVTVSAGLLMGAQPAVAALDTSSVISTVAGTGTPGASGDGGLATQAQLDRPRDADVGPDGSIYIADTFNHAIRRVAPDGTITRFAGTGVAGYGGDDGPATSAMLTWPHDVSVDQLTGDVYIADSNNNRVRKVDTAGTITTVAGNGRVGLAGDGRLATTARLNKPKSVAVGNGRLYIADGLNDAIRVVDLSTGIITRFAGTGVAGFSGDGGPATEAMLHLPQRIAIGPRGGLYVADSLNNRIRKISVNGVINTIAGTGEPGFSGDGGDALLAQIKGPKGIVVNPYASVVYFTDSENNRVRQIDTRTGVISTIAGKAGKGFSGDGGPAGDAFLSNPRGLALDPWGRLLVADKGNSAIRVIDPALAEPALAEPAPAEPAPAEPAPVQPPPEPGN